MGVLNLPNVNPHGYGVPQILSQWQAGQNRRQQKDQFQKEFGLREKQFEFQQEQFKEEKAAKNQLRQAKAQDNAFKFIDTGEKYMGDDKTFQTGVSMSDKGYKMLNEIYPGLNIDVSNIVDAKERKKEAQKQMILGLTELHKRAVGGDEKAIALMPGALAGASAAGIDETTLKYLKDFKPEGVGEERKKEAQKQMILGLTELHKRAVGGDEKAIALMPGALAGASAAGIDKTTLEFLKDYKPEPTGTMTDIEGKTLESLKSDYMQTMGRYWSAKRGEGQFIEDPNAQQVAKEALKAAVVMAGQYKDRGGNIKDLGIDEAALEGKDTQEEMAEMPSPTDHKGKTLRDTKTNKRFRSDGKKWIEIK